MACCVFVTWLKCIKFVSAPFSSGTAQQQLHAQQLPHAAAAAAGHPPPLPLGLGHPGLPPTSAGAALMGQLQGQLPPPPGGGGPPLPLSLLNAAAAAAAASGLPPGIAPPPSMSVGAKHESHREQREQRDRNSLALSEREDKPSMRAPFISHLITSITILNC